MQTSEKDLDILTSQRLKIKAKKLLCLPNHPHKLNLKKVTDIKNEVEIRWIQGCEILFTPEV